MQKADIGFDVMSKKTCVGLGKLKDDEIDSGIQAHSFTDAKIEFFLVVYDIFPVAQVIMLIYDNVIRIHLSITKIIGDYTDLKNFLMIKLEC